MEKADIVQINEKGYVLRGQETLLEGYVLFGKNNYTDNYIKDILNKKEFDHSKFELRLKIDTVDIYSEKVTIFPYLRDFDFEEQQKIKKHYQSLNNKI